jgi:MFS family permease
MYLAERPRSPDAPADGRPTKVAGTVVLMGIVSLLTDISSEAVSAILPLYLTAVVGLSPLAYGLIDGIYQGTSAVVRILGGWWSDRSDRPKWIATLGYGLSAVSKVGLIVWSSFTAVTTVITIDRLGKGLRTAPRDAIIAAVTPPAGLGRAFGVHRAMDTVGAAIGPLVAFSLLWFVPGDYRAVFVVSFAVAVIGVVVLFLFVPDLRPRRARHTDRAVVASDGGDATAGRSPDSRPSLRLLADRRLGRIAVAAAILGALTVSDGFLYLSLQRRDDFASTWFPLLFVGTNAAYALFAIPFGRLADRVGRAKLLVGGHLFLVGAYACASGPAAGLVATLAALACLGAFYASTDGILAALTAGVVRPEVRASGIATTQTVVALARFASSLGFGALWVTWGRDTAVYAVGAALLLALPCVWMIVRSIDRTTLATGGVGPDAMVSE